MKLLLAFTLVIVTGFTGLAIGLNIGIGVGEAKFHNERVRYFQTDVIESARKTESPAKEMLIETAKLAGEMVDENSYPVSRREYQIKIQTLQNHAP